MWVSIIEASDLFEQLSPDHQSRAAEPELGPLSRGGPRIGVTGKAPERREPEDRAQDELRKRSPGRIRVGRGLRTPVGVHEISANGAHAGLGSEGFRESLDSPALDRGVVIEQEQEGAGRTARAQVRGAREGEH